MQSLGFPLNVAQLEDIGHIFVCDGAGSPIYILYIMYGYDIRQDTDKAQYEDGYQGQELNAEPWSVLFGHVLFYCGHVILLIQTGFVRFYSAMEAVMPSVRVSINCCRLMLFGLPSIIMLAKSVQASQYLTPTRCRLPYCDCSSIACTAGI